MREKSPTWVCNDNDSSNSYRYVDIDRRNGHTSSSICVAGRSKSIFIIIIS
jgi:hypothetical protein